jgi:hypothetical protein
MVTRTSEKVRRAVFLRAFGRCEYGSCSKVAARYREDGSIIAQGHFCHILPLADQGPRSEYKQQFAAIEIDSPQNVILLCAEHHQAVDVDQLSLHPPALLFEMVSRKSTYVNEAVADLFENNPYVFDYVEVAQDIRVGRIFDLMNAASVVGPKGAKPYLTKAAVVLKDIERNPYVQIPADLVALINLELIVRGLINSYQQPVWKNGLPRAETLLRKIKSVDAIASAILILMIFVRDVYDVFTLQERLRLIKVLLNLIDPILESVKEARPRAFLLAIKAGLLRWRGRLQNSNEQQLSYREAERCAHRSVAEARSSSGLLQLALLKFAKSRILPISQLRQHDEYLGEATGILGLNELDTFGPVIKYRPRFYRDISEFETGINCFWQAIDLGHIAEMNRDAFVLGECSTSIFIFKSRDTATLARASDFLHHAIRNGFDHGRNFMAWISCHALLEPHWFEDQFLSRFEQDQKPRNPMLLLKDETVRHFGVDSFEHDSLFGVDEIEFWNMLGRLCRTALSDPDRALRYYEVADRYAGPGHFATKIGRVDCGSPCPQKRTFVAVLQCPLGAANLGRSVVY